MKPGTLFRRITDAMALLAGVCLVTIVFIICVDVGMRHFLNKPQVWTVEICEYLLFAITFLGAPWLLRVGGHVNVDIVTEHLPKKARDILSLFSCTVGALVCAILTYFGIVTAIDCFRSGVIEVRTLDVPKYYFMVVIAVGYFLLFGEFCRQGLRQIADLRKES
jgi:TRAP-type C4-dicarboxylate transport system permease small subunit